MKKYFKSAFLIYAVLVLMTTGLVVVQAEGQRRNEREIRDIVRSLNSKIDDFRSNLANQLKSSAADPQERDDIESELRDLEEKLDVFQENVKEGRENRDDVSELLESARNVDQFLSISRQNRKLETDWTSIRGLLDRLANRYGVIPGRNDNNSNVADSGGDPRNTQVFTQPLASTLGNPLTGTYRLDASKSENIANIVSNSNVNGAQRQDLAGKLEAPEQIAIDLRGNQVTLASSKAPPITFEADGREKTETFGSNTLRVRATLRGQELTISSLGGETDYTVTFSPSGDGRTLKVTRRITTDYLGETVFAESFYDKTDPVALLGVDKNPTANAPDNGAYSSNDSIDGSTSDRDAPAPSLGRIGETIVPNGTIVTTVLDSEINTRTSRDKERFRMTVQSPDAYRGAIIEGYISGVRRSGQVSGRSNIAFNFERITLRDGKTYDFAGALQSIKDNSGRTVKVDTESMAKGDSQTKNTAVRGGIGAGIGAIIGAIVDGGRGAAIGAVIGGGAGAGSVIFQGPDDIRLMKGSTITLQASSSTVQNQNQTVSEN